MKAALIVLSAAFVGIYGDVNTCSAPKGPCESHGKCATECVATNPVVGATAPTTCTPVCAGTNDKCSWKCITGADACENVNDACGANSRCVTECSANAIVGLGTATCNPACTVSGESCSWKCEVNGNASACAAVSNQCGSNGKCSTECVPSNPVLGTSPPSCTSSPCAGDVCSWKCITGPHSCANVNDACGANSRCVTECSANAIVGLGTATCNPTCTATGKTCSWKCEVKGNASTCAAVGNTCGNNGKCSTDCVPSNPVLGTRNPSCASSSCTGGDLCSWKCITGPHSCAKVNDVCGTNSRCVTECSANAIAGLGTPTCNPECTATGKACSWKCEVKAKPPDSGASRPTLLLPLNVLCILLRIQNLHE